MIQIKYVENANQAELMSLKKTVLIFAVTNTEHDIIAPKYNFAVLPLCESIAARSPDIKQTTAAKPAKNPPAIILAKTSLCGCEYVFLKEYSIGGECRDAATCPQGPGYAKADTHTHTQPRICTS